MKQIVVEANIVFHALIKRGFIFKLIRLLSKKGYVLYSPDFITEEVNKRKERILKFSKLTAHELDFVTMLLFKFIKEVPKSEYSPFISESLKLFPSHPKDAPYFALALSKKIPLWSDEKRHKSQSRVRVLSTADLKELLNPV